MTSYNIFTKHAEKVTKKVKSRPVLQGAYHQADGSVVATDSHRLYKLYNGFQTTEAFIQNLTTGERIDGNYPDTSRLIPEMADAQLTVQANVKQLLDASKAMFTAHKAVNKNNRHLTLQLKTEGNQLYLVAGGGHDLFQANYLISDVSAENINIHMQGQYLIDALALFKDAGESEINIRFYGDVRPFILESKDVTALILPVRVY